MDELCSDVFEEMISVTTGILKSSIHKIMCSKESQRKIKVAA